MHAALLRVLLFLAAVLPAALPTAAQQADGTPQDKAAIQAIVKDEQDAWNRGDATAFAAHFAADGSFTNIVGMQTYGRAPFEKQHALIFSTIYKGSYNELSIGKLHFLRPDVAIVDVDALLSKITTLAPGSALFPDGALHTKLQLVLSKEQGTWQIDAFHNVPVNPKASGPPK